MGVKTKSNGYEYNGEWKYGNKHGKGLLKYPNGSRKEVLYDNGVRIYEGEEK